MYRMISAIVVTCLAVSVASAQPKPKVSVASMPPVVVKTAESKEKAKTDTAVASKDYDKMGKEELQRVLKNLQKEVSLAEQKQVEAHTALQQAQRPYGTARSDKEKSDALLPMVEAEGVYGRASQECSKLNSEFRRAQEAYIKLLAPEKPKTEKPRPAKPKSPTGAALSLLQFEEIANVERLHIKRAKVRGGWLIVLVVKAGPWQSGETGGIAFYPDPNHEWNGASMK